MALLFTQKLRTSLGGKAFRCYEVTCDGTNVSIDASDLDMNFISTAMVMGPGDLVGTLNITASAFINGDGSTLTGIPLIGAVLGDAVEVGTSGDNIDLIITAYVKEADVAEIRIQNESEGERTPENDYVCRIRKNVGLKTYSGDGIVFGPKLQSGDKIVVWAIGG